LADTGLAVKSEAVSSVMLCSDPDMRAGEGD